MPRPSSDNVTSNWVTPAALAAFGIQNESSPFSDVSESLGRRLLILAEFAPRSAGELLVSQYHHGSYFYFLLEGSVNFSLRLEAEGHDLDVGSSNVPWTPIGWSAFREPFRYATSARTSAPCQLLRFRVEELTRFFEAEPALGYSFFRAVTRAASTLLLEARERLVSGLRERTAIPHWSTFPSSTDHSPSAGRVHARSGRARGRTSSRPPAESNTVPQGTAEQIRSEEGMVTNAAPHPFEILRRSPFFEQLPEALLDKVRHVARVRYFYRGDILQEQGALATDFLVLADGKVRLEYTGETGRTAVLRILGDRGAVLSASTAAGNDSYDITARATRDGSLIEFPRGLLEEVLRESPSWACQFQKRVLWLLGRQLRVARAHLVSETFDREVLAIESVLEQVRTELSVSSPLHKLPHLLSASVTLPDALAVVDAARTSRDMLTAHTAELCHELLGPVRRENRFFAGLQAAFEEVVHAARQTEPAQIRRRSAESFIRVFSQVPSEVVGTHLLPPFSGSIFIFNHLKNHEHNTLPNGFQLTLDSHFISAMILHKHYGDPGVRVVRRSRATEYAHQAYYERLGHVPVYTPESDIPSESRSERFSAFIEAASRHLSQGLNLVLAPEGTSCTTDESPGPFKAGAFRLAGAIHPQPLIVPIAMANFDRWLSHTKLVAVIHPPFRISARVKNLDDAAEMERFLTSYRAEFREHVREASEISRRS